MWLHEFLDTFMAHTKIPTPYWCREIDGDISFVPLNLDRYEYQLTYTIKLMLISQFYKGDVVQSVRVYLKRRKKLFIFFSIKLDFI